MAGTQVRSSTASRPMRMGENHKLARASSAVGQRTGGSGYFLLTFFAESPAGWVNGAPDEVGPRSVAAPGVGVSSPVGIGGHLRKSTDCFTPPPAGRGPDLPALPLPDRAEKSARTSASRT